MGYEASTEPGNKCSFSIVFAAKSFGKLPAVHCNQPKNRFAFESGWRALPQVGSCLALNQAEHNELHCLFWKDYSG